MAGTSLQHYGHEVNLIEPGTLAQSKPLIMSGGVQPPARGGGDYIFLVSTLQISTLISTLESMKHTAHLVLRVGNKNTLNHVRRWGSVPQVHR